MSFRLALHCTSTRRESLVISSRYLQLHFMGQEQTYPSPFAPTMTPFSNYKETLWTENFRCLMDASKRYGTPTSCFPWFHLHNGLEPAYLRFKTTSLGQPSCHRLPLHLVLSSIHRKLNPFVAHLRDSPVASASARTHYSAALPV